MEKDFDKWNQKKKLIELVDPENFVFHKREIWWCSIGLNIGEEEDGKNDFFERPVLVVRKFNRKIAWVVPMSTKIKTGPFYHTIRGGNIEYSILLSQIRLISVKRFRRYIGKISQYQFMLAKEKIVLLLD